MHPGPESPGQPGSGVEALIAQLAAGQVEALYGMQAATTALHQRAQQLEQAVEALTADLAAVVDEATARLRSEGESVLAEIRRQAAAAAEAMQSAAETFGSDVHAATHGVTVAGETILTQLIATLDERDARDQRLEERFTARFERLSTRTADRVAELAALLESQTARLEQRDLADRRRNAEDLRDVVERLLSEPRARLKELRAATAQALAEPVPSDDPPAETPRPTRRKGASG